jgi:hypothetical protein
MNTCDTFSAFEEGNIHHLRVFRLSLLMSCVPLSCQSTQDSEGENGVSAITKSQNILGFASTFQSFIIYSNFRLKFYILSR